MIREGIRIEVGGGIDRGGILIVGINLDREARRETIASARCHWSPAGTILVLGLVDRNNRRRYEIMPELFPSIQFFNALNSAERAAGEQNGVWTVGKNHVCLQSSKETKLTLRQVMEALAVPFTRWASQHNTILIRKEDNFPD